MLAFEALSFADKWRTSRYVFHGKAPQDPQLAGAAIELAERYQQHSWAKWARMLLPVVIVVSIAAVIQAAINGDAVVALVSGLVALTNLAQFALNPATRPKKRRTLPRSIEADHAYSITSKSRSLSEQPSPRARKPNKITLASGEAAVERLAASATGIIGHRRSTKIAATRDLSATIPPGAEASRRSSP